MLNQLKLTLTILLKKHWKNIYTLKLDSSMERVSMTERANDKWKLPHKNSTNAIIIRPPKKKPCFKGGRTF